LNVISNWAKKWAIQFNPQKTKNIVRRDREHPPVYFGLNGDEIDETDNHCHLGITFQSSATWKKHIDDIYIKACSRLLLLRQVKHLLDNLRFYYYHWVDTSTDGLLVLGVSSAQKSVLLSLGRYLY
jgi:hypothetical protein